MIRAEWRDYDTAAEMVDAVAEDIGFAIGSALDARGTALIALPGGKSPAPIFERLADAVLDWNRVTIIPTDERVVPADSPLSNVAMIALIAYRRRRHERLPQRGSHCGYETCRTSMAARSNLARGWCRRTYRVDLPGSRS